MKYSNFKFIGTVGKYPSEQIDYATVDVTTGFLWWKKIKPLKIFKSAIATYWRDLYTGEFTEGRYVEDMHRKVINTQMAKEAQKVLINV